jgi:hypothetical protein
VPNVCKGKLFYDSTMDKFSHHGFAAPETYRSFISKSTVGLQNEATKEEKNNSRRNHQGYIKKVSVFLVPCGGVRLSRLVRWSVVGLLYQLRMIDDECGTYGGMRIGRGN